VTNLTFKVEYQLSDGQPLELQDRATLLAEQDDSELVLVLQREAGAVRRNPAQRLIALSMDDDSLDWETLGRVDELAWGADAETQ